MKYRRHVLLILLVLFSFAQAQDKSLSTEDVVTQGRTCISLEPHQLSCQYRVGNDLAFQIRVGPNGPMVFIEKSGGSSGDYFIDFNGVTMLVVDLQNYYGYQFLFYNSCIPIAGEGGHAFVSPANGRVYSDAKTCDVITKKIYRPEDNLKQVKLRMIEDSINSYSGNCPCPYNIMVNGRICGVNSAYSKPGGRSPLCYETNITDEQARGYSKNNPSL